MIPTVDTAAAARAAAAGTEARARLTESFDTFLTLLTTQLRNQDPTNPLDSTQFTEQLVQYSQVEQQIETNNTLKGLVSAQNASVTGAALGMMGRTITVASDRAELAAETGARWTYELPQAAANATLVIRDASGREVGRAEAERGAGRHGFDWSGEDARGRTWPPGVYTLAVEAADEAGRPITAKTYAAARVSGVETGPEGVRLATRLGPFPFESVIAVTDGD